MVFFKRSFLYIYVYKVPSTKLTARESEQDLYSENLIFVCISNLEKKTTMQYVLYYTFIAYI